jgi:hypothetical protein
VARLEYGSEKSTDHMVAQLCQRFGVRFGFDVFVGHFVEWASAEATSRFEFCRGGIQESFSRNEFFFIH